MTFYTYFAEQLAIRLRVNVHIVHAAFTAIGLVAIYLITKLKA